MNPVLGHDPRTSTPQGQGLLSPSTAIPTEHLGGLLGIEQHIWFRSEMVPRKGEMLVFLNWNVGKKVGNITMEPRIQRFDPV